MKKYIYYIFISTLFLNNLFPQSGIYLPFKIQNENFSIGNYRGVEDYSENYKILNDSIIFAYNQDNVNNNVFYSLDYGLNFKSESYSNFFGLKEKKSSIRKLITDKDKIYIQVFQEGNYDSTKIFVFDTNNPSSKPTFLFTETGTDKGQGISLKYLFKDSFIGQSYKNLFIWKEKKWVKLDLPVQYDVLQSFESDDYLYTFFSDKIQGNNTNNSCYRTKDLKNWEILENFTFTYREGFDNMSIEILAIHEDKIVFNNKPRLKLIYDIKSKEIEENNVIKNKFGNTRSCFSMFNKRLFIKSNTSNVYEFKNNTLLDLGLYNGNGDIKFSFTDKFGIFSTDGIYFFDNKLISQKNKNLKREISISKIESKTEVLEIVKNDYQVAKNLSKSNLSNNSTITDNLNCYNFKQFKSKEILSYKEYIQLKLLDGDYENEICSSSDIKIAEYLNENGNKKGYHIYFFSTSGKKIKDEYLDAKGRLIGQYIYEYDSQNKGKFMYTLNYKSEIISARVVEPKEIIYVNYEKPYPNTKESALKRYRNPSITQFTDLCQPCKGSGYNKSFTHKCMVCNGAGSIKHKIVKY